MSELDSDPNPWAENLSPASAQIWREALAHLRYLNDEVVKSFKFFMAGNAIIPGLAALMALMFSGAGQLIGAIVSTLVLATLGLGWNLMGRQILKRNRVYYLQMLLKKTLLENEFGFYAVKFPGTKSDLAFPWRLDPETIPELRDRPAEWVARQIRGRGTIARWWFIALETCLAVFALLLAGLCLAVMG